MTFQVNSKMCSSCIFGQNSPISDECFEELKTLWAKNKQIQQCHVSSMQKGTVGCRGHYEASKREEIPHPLSGVFGDHLDIRQTLEIGERLGLIEFVEVSDKRK